MTRNEELEAKTEAEERTKLQMITDDFDMDEEEDKEGGEGKAKVEVRVLKKQLEDAKREEARSMFEVKYAL